MSLDISHGDFHIHYHGFARFRKQVAQSAGFYEFQKQPCNSKNWEDYYAHDYLATNYNYEKHSLKNYEGYWKKTPRDPLLVLLIHYDDRGFIFRKQQKPLAIRLKNISRKITDEILKKRVMQLAESLNWAHELNETLIFK